MNESPHIDIYINGQFQNCATTWGNTPLNSNPVTGVPNDDAIGPAFAGEPGGHVMAVGIFGEGGAPIEGSISGGTRLDAIVDEVRLWAADRTNKLVECKDTEIGPGGGNCGIQGSDYLVGYFRFDEGTGTDVGEWSGLGSAVKERPNPAADPNNPTLEWTAGWTTDVPDLKRVSWSLD
jgi:hypothetical protein